MRHLALSSVAATLALLTTAVVALPGCPADDAPPPQAIFLGRLELADEGTCKNPGPLFQVGAFENLAAEPAVAPQPVKNGDAYAGGSASVDCSVVGAGAAGYTVTASVALSGGAGGFFRMSGTVQASGESTNVRGSFSSAQAAAAYEQNDGKCVVRVTQAGRIAAGRIWGEIECPTVTDRGTESTCSAVAEFRFENCGQ